MPPFPFTSFTPFIEAPTPPVTYDETSSARCFTVLGSAMSFAVTTAPYVCTHRNEETATSTIIKFRYFLLK
ncbi:hypothetical protein POVCU1_018650 [Plasmodium ovale curtisi]|uniref:Uncharacterized protein n=1 Tax=Plasmodium ovale curtisi TaxID=864141 RepID=A0A1A8WCI6_PLAOA|nr:hypothetical protein POVCU1_018650 [Plasmodium ovale curtisi]